jgi:hypothetical protein
MDIKFEEFKNEINVTLSGLLRAEHSDSVMKRVLAIQEELVRGFQDDPAVRDVSKIESSSALDTWSLGPSGRRLFVCPTSTIHFSILNFINEKIKSGDFANARARVQSAKRFRGFRKAICSNCRIQPRTFEIRGIFMGKDPGSIALMTFPIDTDKDHWLKQIRTINTSVSKIYEAYCVPKRYQVDEDKRLKAYWDGERYFATNIVRFLRGHEEEALERPNHFSQIVSEQDGRLRLEPIRFKLRPLLVISNAYLSNLRPRWTAIHQTRHKPHC